MNKTGTTVTIQQGDESVRVTLNDEDGTVTPGPNGSVTIPAGSTINPVDGPSITVIAPSEVTISQSSLPAKPHSQMADKP